MIQKSMIIRASEYILGFKLHTRPVRRLQVQSLSEPGKRSMSELGPGLGQYFKVLESCTETNE